MGVYNGKFVKFPGSRGKTAGNIDIYSLNREKKSATRPPEILIYPSILSQRYVKSERSRLFRKKIDGQRKVK